jgi:hypothetical protein
VTKALLPDPVLTASIYCAGHLDHVIQHVARPVWVELRQQTEYDLWLMRYGRGGEHLKLRIHGPETEKLLFQERLSATVRRYFASLGEGFIPSKAGRWKNTPAVDAEDDTTIDHPDRTLVWTCYQRSPISLGGKPLLEDDQYVSLLTTCLARATDLILEEPEFGPDREIPHRRRQSILIKILMEWIVGLGYDAEKRAPYLAYHRDCLLRFVLLQVTDPIEKAREILLRYSILIERMGTSIEALRQVMSNTWSDERVESAVPTVHAWRRSLGDFLHYLGPFCKSPGHQIDPFTMDPIFAPLFKLFHSAANVLGLPLVDEAFTYHLLLTLSPSEFDHARVELVPAYVRD